jgi:thioesterase domain-containing protein
MTPAELQQYLHRHIPLSAAMLVTVQAATAEAVVLAAPLAPNINHRATLFGGSASAIGLLACWSLLHLRLVAAGLPSRIVVRRHTMDYLQPVAGAFTVRATLSEPASWAPFAAQLARKGKARIAVGAELTEGGAIAGRLAGEFVALPGSDG